MLEYILMVAAAVACALFIRIFLFEVAFVKGNSMQPTLRPKEALFVNALAYKVGRPKRHDIVICHYPGRMMRQLSFIPQQFVKRVIGLPGETVELIEGVVYINGEPLDEPYLDPKRNKFKRSRDPITLGEDEYYVMGDNRDNSNDSRRIGPLKRTMIIGRVETVILPFSGIRKP